MAVTGLVRITWGENFSRVLVATRLDVSLAVTAVGLSLLVGSMAGACAGFYGGWVDRLVSRVVDTIMAFPLFVLAMGIVAALGNTVANIILATAIINLPFYARIARSEVNVRRPALALSKQPGCAAIATSDS